MVEVKALRLGARRRSIGLYVYGVIGGPTLVPEEGVAYIECARTPAIPCHTGFNVPKERMLLVMPALK